MKEKLDPNQILIAEFEYAAQTARQANEDRGKVFELFLANIFTLFAAALLPNIFNFENRAIYVFIFLGLFIFGLVSLFQLVKTRVAWKSSVIAMNKIKDFYVENNKDLARAFKWRMDNIPKANSKLAVIFAQGISIMVLNAMNITFIIYLLLFQGFRLLYIPILVIPFFICFIMQFIVWEKLLKN
ncbi:MAG: hypothetical protein ABI721_04655 [Candidatus Dojkabacteria bacterium]